MLNSVMLVVVALKIFIVVLLLKMLVGFSGVVL